VVSNLGAGIDAAALPLLTTTPTRDPRLVAGLGVAFTLPWLLFALPAGAIVDRLDRRKVMYRVNIVRAALVGLIALSVVTETASIGLLYVVAFCLGTAETLFDNAAQSILPSIVRPEQLELANGREYAGEVVANTFIGPPIGGLLFAVAASVPFWIDSASFLVAALVVATIAGSFRPAGARARDEKRSLRADIAEGVRWLRHHHLLRTLALLLGAMNFASNMCFATFVLFAQDELGLDDRGFGVLLAATAVGSVLGSFLGPRITAAVGPGSALVAAIALGGFGEAAIGLMSNPIPVAALSWITGLFFTVWNIITVSLRQSIIPDELLGRVNSVYRFLGWGSIPLGALAGGWIARAFGLRAPYLAAAVITTVCLLVGAPRLTTAKIKAAKAAATATAQPATPLTPAPPSIT
jgi:MFS family permease